MKKLIVPFSALCILSYGCQSNDVMESKNVAQSEIHQHYSVNYDLATETFYVNAELRVAGPTGTTLVLSEPSDITCNGEELKLDTYLLGGAYYQLSKSTADCKGKADFDFIDIDKKHYKNKFNVNRIDINVSTFLLKDSNNIITVKTAPLEPDEKMWLEIQGDSLSTEVSSQQGNISISASDLRIFYPKEKLALQVIREKSGKLSQTTARGGTYNITSSSRKVMATLK